MKNIEQRVTIANVEILSGAATIKAAAAYKGKRAQNRRDAIIQVYMSSAYNYVDSSDVKHLNNIIEVARDNGQVRAAQGLVKAVAFHSFDKEKQEYKGDKLTKKQKEKRDDIHSRIESIIEDWFKGEKKSNERAFNPATRFTSLIKGMIEKAGMTPEQAREYIQNRLDTEVEKYRELDA